MRSVESYAEKVGNTFVRIRRAGLVAEPDDWPYQGEIHILPW